MTTIERVAQVLEPGRRSRKRRRGRVEECLASPPATPLREAGLPLAARRDNRWPAAGGPQIATCVQKRLDPPPRLIGFLGGKWATTSGTMTGKRRALRRQQHGEGRDESNGQAAGVG